MGHGDLTLLLISKEPNIEELIKKYQPQGPCEKDHINKSIIAISIIIYFNLFTEGNKGKEEGIVGGLKNVKNCWFRVYVCVYVCICVCVYACGCVFI